MKSTKLVGIINITPDSFSDGGIYLNPVTAINNTQRMLDLGVEILDLGAISTRPNQNELPTYKEEIARFNDVLPIIKPLLSNFKISIDSYNYETVKYLLDHIDIAWVNDQSAGSDERMIDLISHNNIKIVIMHHLSIPTDPSKVMDEECNVIEATKKWLIKKANYLIARGLKQEQIILDPGIGFGKTAEQSWELIRSAEKFTNIGYSILYGHSRKSFMNSITNKIFAQRDLETAILSGLLAQKGIDYLRVHDIETNLTALKLMEKIDES